MRGTFIYWYRLLKREEHAKKGNRSQFKTVAQDIPEIAHVQTLCGYMVMSAKLSHVIVELTTRTTV